MKGQGEVLTGQEWVKQIRQLAKDRNLFEGETHMINAAFSLDWMKEYILEGKTPEEALEIELKSWKGEE